MIPKGMSIKEAMARRHERKVKRKNKRKLIFSGKPSLSLVKVGPLKKEIVTWLGKLDAKVNGPWCRLGEECPQFPKIGKHFGQLGYHLSPQQRGDAARFLPANVIWACSPANFGEKWNRSAYREKHIRLFGQERVERLEEVAGSTADFTKANLLELRKRLVAAVLGDGKFDARDIFEAAGVFFRPRV